MPVLILLFLSLSSFSQEVTLGYTNSYNLILKSNSCENILEDHEAICSWKELLEKDFKAPQVDQSFCEDRGANKYRSIVNSCLPSFTKKYHRRKLYNSGANCWGTALSFKRISKKPRFIWSKEMIYWMNSPICRKLESFEKKQAGDIINVYGPEYFFGDHSKTKGDLFWDALYPSRFLKSPVERGYTGYHNFLHSETYLSPRITFGKDSPNKLDRFNFNKLNEVYGRARDVKCQENGDLSPHHREYLKKPRNLDQDGCKYFTTISRCQDFKSYFSNAELTLEEKIILDETNSLEEVQKELFSLLVDSKIKISESQVKKILKRADAASKNALEKLSVLGLRKNHEMLLTLKYFTAEGIRKSLELADLTSPTETL